MATTIQKITLSASRDIPFNKLVLSQANVRRVKAGISIEELAEDIARRTLLQGLSVRAVVDADGNETGMFEVPAGGRRFRALELLVKQKRLAKTVPVPCVVRDGGIAEEDSLAENVQRVALHPLDQSRAFQALRERGLGDEEIAARFFVNPTVVKQRLRLAAVSPKLLDIYAEDCMTLEQLMAFTVTADHARQEQVWDSVSRSYNKEPYLIRRQLTKGAVRAADRRALFIGIEAYEAAGGVVMRDLFQQDDGGWLQDPALLDRLVTERLQAEAESLRDEGWRWIAVATDFPYGHSAGLRRLVGETAEVTEEEAASFEALQTEYETLEAEHAGASDLPEAVDQRLGEIETAMAAFENRPIRFDPADVARAGIFVSIDSDGALRVERGFVRPEDEAPVAPVPTEADDTPEPTSTEIPVQRAAITIGGAPAASEPEAPEEDDTIRPLSDRLVTELTAHRTLALRDGVANDPQVAFQAVLHALCLNAFYRYAASTCLEITAKQSGFSAQAPGLAETASAKAIDARHAQWAKQLPETPADLWDTLTAFDSDSQATLFAHCASLTINVVKEPWNRRPDAFAHGDQLAYAVDLDMAAVGWKPNVAAAPTNPGPAAAIAEVARLLLPDLERGCRIDAAILRAAMERAFGGSDAEGAWDWKTAYDSCEAATVLFLRKFGPAMRARGASPTTMLPMLTKIGGLLPTHTRRSEESQAFQQFSTPITLGLAASTAAAITPADLVLEPSAGTGLLAILAELAGGALMLNELADTRAGLLARLFPSIPVTRFDAAQIDDHLGAGVRPSVVLMNPPFSAMAHVDRRMADTILRHVRSALARLADGGRLVAITGANFAPDNPAWTDAFAQLRERGRVVFSAAIDGTVYAKHGTNIDTRLTVIDKIAIPCRGWRSRAWTNES